MPFYEFKDSQGNIHERLFSIKDAPEYIELENGDKAYRIISLPAFTPNKWGKLIGGVNGIYDRGLDKTYATMAEREKLCKELGKEPISYNQAMDLKDKRKQQREDSDKRIKAHEKAMEAVKKGHGYKYEE